MRAAVPIFLFFALAAAGARAEPPIQGPGAVIDGDSLRVAGLEIRLWGADAFEWNQVCEIGGRDVACGKEAARHLARLISGWTVSCWPRGSSYDRVVARCRVRDTDLAQSLLEAGWAVIDPRYTRRYRAAEAIARRERRGAWDGAFAKPWDWRRARRK